MTYTDKELRDWSRESSKAGEFAREILKLRRALRELRAMPPWLGTRAIVNRALKTGKGKR